MLNDSNGPQLGSFLKIKKKHLNSKLLLWKLWTCFLFLKGAGYKLRSPSPSPASFWSQRGIFSNKSGYLHHRDKSNSKGFTLHLWAEVWSIFRIFCYFSCLTKKLSYSDNNWFNELVFQNLWTIPLNLHLHMPRIISIVIFSKHFTIILVFYNQTLFTPILSAAFTILQNSCFALFHLK